MFHRQPGSALRPTANGGPRKGARVSKWISVGIGPVRIGSTIKGPSQSEPSAIGCGGVAGTLLVGLVLLPFLVPWQYTAAVYGTIAVIALVIYLKTKSYLRKVELERERRRLEAEEREFQRQLEAATRRQAREDQLQLKREVVSAKKKNRAEQRQAWIEAGKNSVTRLSLKSKMLDPEQQPDTTRSEDIGGANTLRARLRRDRPDSQSN